MLTTLKNREVDLDEKEAQAEKNFRMIKKRISV